MSQPSARQGKEARRARHGLGAGDKVLPLQRAVSARKSAGETGGSGGSFGAGG
ncbi:hypothetical protein AB0D14_13535 [Streptomyces sp. NPDC048484]|uniref:hypothetical protein n=1 Tax=Streptomyces sp. NPDC048484 TaxID=3155146 RepID=UPI0034175E3E